MVSLSAFASLGTETAWVYVDLKKCPFWYSNVQGPNISMHFDKKSQGSIRGCESWLVRDLPPGLQSFLTRDGRWEAQMRRLWPYPTQVPRWISDLTRIWRFAAEMTWKQKKRMNRNIYTVMISNAIYKGVMTTLWYVRHLVETVWFCIFKVCQERLGLDGLRYYREDGKSTVIFPSFFEGWGCRGEINAVGVSENMFF